MINRALCPTRYSEKTMHQRAARLSGHCLAALAVAIAVFSLNVTSARTQTTSDPMRGLIWGLPEQAVRNYEAAEFIGAEGGYLAYSDVIRPAPDKRSFKVTIEYQFDKNGLSRIRYDIPVSRGDPQRALDDVMTWQFWFDDVFAQTSEPQFSFRNPNIRADPARWGWAIYRGDAHMRIHWRDEKTRATLTLSGRDYMPSLVVVLEPDRAASAVRP